MRNVKNSRVQEKKFFCTISVIIHKLNGIKHDVKHLLYVNRQSIGGMPNPSIRRQFQFERKIKFKMCLSNFVQHKNASSLFQNFNNKMEIVDVIKI